MIDKVAYVLGTVEALTQIGLIKKAEDDPTAQKEQDVAPKENPAELLADIFNKADVQVPRPGPDNKTKPEETQIVDKGTKWGPQITGTGGEFLERLVPGFSLPAVSSI